MTRLLLYIAVFQLFLATGHYITMLVDLIEGLITPIRYDLSSDEYFQFPARPAFLAQEVFFYTNVRDSGVL